MKLFTEINETTLETNADWLQYCEKVKQEYIEDFRTMLASLLEQDEGTNTDLRAVGAPIRRKGVQLGIEDEAITPHSKLVTKAITPILEDMLQGIKPDSPKGEHIKLAMKTHRYFVSFCMALHTKIEEIQNKDYDMDDDDDIADFLSDGA